MYIFSGECVPTDESCISIKCNAGTTYISDSAQCPELRCVAPDCEKCVSNQCSWTRLVNRGGRYYGIRDILNIMINFSKLL